jgi:hypothetical protein
VFCFIAIKIFVPKYSENDNVSQLGIIVFARKAAMENGQDGVNGISPLPVSVSN